MEFHAALKTMHARDELNVLHLAGNDLLNWDTLRKAAPKNPVIVRMPEFNFDSLEEATAAVFNALSRRHALSLRRSGDKGDYDGYRADLPRFPFHTWVLGHPYNQDAALSTWFADKSNQSNFRLFIQRNPLTYREKPLSPVTGIVYGRSRKPIKLTGEITSREQKEQSEQFLKKMLEAYNVGDVSAVRDLMEESGHPYWASTEPHLKDSEWR